jgi:broad specificity phosphatase PhoE
MQQPGSEPREPREPGSLPACRLILVRHGETSWNVLSRLQGQTDTPLNAEGERQAAATAALLASTPSLRPSCIVSSDLQRAARTAAAIAAACGGLPVRLDARLRETNLGAWQGSSWEAVAREDGPSLRAWRADAAVCAPGGGESRGARFSRTAMALQEVALEFLGRAVVVVCHGGNLDDASRLALGAPFGEALALPKQNCSVNVIEFAAAPGAAAAGGGAAAVAACAAFSPAGASPAAARTALGEWRLVEWGGVAHLGGGGSGGGARNDVESRA